jgi:hypothetical protein
MPFEVLELDNPKWEQVLAHSEANIAYRPEYCRFNLRYEQWSSIVLKGGS